MITSRIFLTTQMIAVIWILAILIVILLICVLFAALPHNTGGKIAPLIIITFSLFVAFIWVTPSLPECMECKNKYRRYFFLFVYFLFVVIIGLYIWLAKDGCQEYKPFF